MSIEIIKFGKMHLFIDQMAKNPKYTNKFYFFEEVIYNVKLEIKVGLYLNESNKI
jgi:hypothetical protein